MKMEQIELKDDGYSGKNMEHPAMQELLSMIKKGKVSCIIVKDISRFSRDYIETGKYMEQIFPFLGIRFISINDNYDSAECTGGIAELDVAFKEILYDFYSEDLSEKVKTSLSVRRVVESILHHLHRMVTANQKMINISLKWMKRLLILLNVFTTNIFVAVPCIR